MHSPQITDREASELEGLEMALLQAFADSDPDAARALLDEAFREFGESGRVWSRDGIVDALSKQAAPPGMVESPRELEVRAIADGVALVTYQAGEPGREARRSSLWRRGGERGWTMVFHQGTVIPADA